MVIVVGWQFLAERPSIANPWERAMMNEGVRVIIV
jgi:hypothetical protein